MRITLSLVALAACASVYVATPALAQHQMPPGMTHEQHQKQMRKDAELKQRGAAAMGFDQDATAHQFLLADDGGSIEVSVKDAADGDNLAAIRAHLKEIAAAFAQGDFAKPFQTHAEVPPGVDTMKTLKNTISFTYEETSNGGRVRIRTANADTLEAIHAFLNYQISEHHTAAH